jgi:thiamine biosynthesis lipoprotein ApbE
MRVVAMQSKLLIDPAVLLKLWLFDCPLPSWPWRKHLFENSSIAYLMLKDDTHKMVKKTRDIYIDLSAIAKGYQYDRNQAEFTLNFWRYINSRVSSNRLEKGKIKLEETRPLVLVLGACGVSEKINTFTGSIMGTTYTVKTVGDKGISQQKIDDSVISIQE